MKKLIALLTLLASGCATTQNYSRMLATWPGQPEQMLIDRWGYPTRTFKAPNGNTVYAYEYAEQGVTPTYQMPSQTTYTNGGYGMVYANTVNGATIGGQPYVSSCSTYFEVDDTRTITTWRWQGDACVSQ